MTRQKFGDDLLKALKWYSTFVDVKWVLPKFLPETDIIGWKYIPSIKIHIALIRCPQNQELCELRIMMGYKDDVESIDIKAL